MQFIYSKTSDAGFNLASEEYFLKNFDEDIFFLYINSPSIICGKHQNALGEIDFGYTQQKSITVFRRLSGGGTVYHDLGNINFCFITNESKGELVNFEKYLIYITRFLGTKNIESSIGKRHELLVDGKKISGNASHVYKNRVMHHGTLLFDSELDVLNNCLKTEPLKYTDKAVKSVRSEVTNILPYLKESVSTVEFSKELFTWLQTEFSDANRYEITTTDELKINEILESKFSTWKWIYGYSPQYIFEKTIQLDGGLQLGIRMNIQKGIITEIEVTSYAHETDNLANQLQATMKEALHSKREIENKIDQLSNQINTAVELNKEKLLQLFF